MSIKALSIVRTDTIQRRSEIGPIGRIEDSGFEKRRGLLTGLVTSRDDATDLIKRLRNEDELPGHSRLTVRAFVSIPLIEHGAFSNSSVGIEAVVPLDNIQIGSGATGSYAMVYFGRNNGWRDQPAEGNGIKHVKTLTEVRASASTDLVSKLTEVRRNGYEVGLLQRTSSQRGGGEILRLLEPFHYSSEETMDLLEKNENVAQIATVTFGGSFVGIAVVERADILINDRITIPIAEIYGASVLPEHKGKGLYSALSTYLISQTDNDIVLLYSETNLGQRSILQTAANQGRRFSLDVSLQDYGILPGHTKVHDQLQDFIVTYLTREDIERIKLSLRET